MFGTAEPTVCAAAGLRCVNQKENLMPLKVGDVAPDFALMNQDKTVVKLSELRGKRIVLLFYPMDFSPTCTTEHCTFGPALGQIAKDANTVVFGVSCDSPFSHAAYKKQYNIPYDLLADPTRRMAQAYDMWAGLEPYNCTKRGTVVIDQDGKIAHYEEVAMREPRKVEAIAAAAKG
jgi:peroxiredoxin